jgi:hypothetical protein
MKKFLVKSLYFIIPCLLIVEAMDIWLRSTNSLYKEKLNGIKIKKDLVQVLILGNSHANYAVDPSQFSLCAYNLANVNQSIYFDKRLTMGILPEMPKLKYVLISIDFHSLYFSSQGARDFWSYYGNGIKLEDRNYLLANISPFLFGYTPSIGATMLVKRILYVIKYRHEKTIDFVVENGVNIKGTIRNGFMAREGHDEYSFDKISCKARADDFNLIVKSSTDKKAVVYDLMDFIQYLKSRNIIPVLFSSPTYQGFYSCLDKNMISQNQRDIDFLCKKYNLEYLDYANCSLFEMNDFFNCDHLNEKGAEKFSKILSNELTVIDSN